MGTTLFLVFLGKLMFALYLVPVVFWWWGEIAGWEALLGLVGVFVLNHFFALCVRVSNRRLLLKMSKDAAENEDK
jgi:hypothetical protein